MLLQSSLRRTTTLILARPPGRGMRTGLSPQVLRHGLGVWTPLLGAAISTASEEQYRRGVEMFMEWADSTHDGPMHTSYDIDDALAG